MRTLAYTVLALVAFAANSILCRIALSQPAVDPATFSSIRLISGAATLLLVTTMARGTGARSSSSSSSSWIAAGVLAAYAVPFAFAYTQLSAGTGALILFGWVQVTMLVAAVASGERPHAAHWIGLSIALAGLVYLVLPGVSAPPPAGAALMSVAGVGWGTYSLLGRGTKHPLAHTTANFVRAVPMGLAVSAVLFRQFHLEASGAWLAVASGSLASGVGYALWYAALRGLSATRAAIVQLAVPVIAAAGGVLFLGEGLSRRFLIATILIIGGIAMTIRSTERPSQLAGQELH